MKLRMRIVYLLGQLGGEINVHLVKAGHVPDLSKAMAWDTDKHLSLALPFQDMKPTVTLGKY